MPGFELPVFSCAFVFGILFKKLLDKTHASESICPQTVGHISGSMTDYLVAFGIASIKVSVVIEYIVPLAILLLSGLAITLIYVFVMARKLMKECWFEKALFTWGWFTGTMAMGIALLRVVDPKMKSRCLDSYALAYLFIAPVEISLITFAPVAFVNGYGLLFSGICLAAGSAISDCSLSVFRVVCWHRSSTRWQWAFRDSRRASLARLGMLLFCRLLQHQSSCLSATVSTSLCRQSRHLFTLCV